MKIYSPKLILVCLLSVSAGGCATYANEYPNSPGYSSGYGRNVENDGSYARYMGTVSSVETIDLGSNNNGYRSPGLGAVAGAVIGGALGNQVGSGTGKTVATVGGAVVGGVIGDRIERNRDGYSSGSQWGQRVYIRLDNGQETVLVQPGSGLHMGDRVRVVGYGSQARAVIY
jgi:outer membrane lipoprotein SlyB